MMYNADSNRSFILSTQRRVKMICLPSGEICGSETFTRSRYISKLILRTGSLPISAARNPPPTPIAISVSRKTRFILKASRFQRESIRSFPVAGRRAVGKCGIFCGGETFVRPHASSVVVARCQRQSHSLYCLGFSPPRVCCSGHEGVVRIAIRFAVPIGLACNVTGTSIKTLLPRGAKCRGRSARAAAAAIVLDRTRRSPNEHDLDAIWEIGRAGKINGQGPVSSRRLAGKPDPDRDPSLKRPSA